MYRLQQLVWTLASTKSAVVRRVSWVLQRDRVFRTVSALSEDLLVEMGVVDFTGESDEGRRMDPELWEFAVGLDYLQTRLDGRGAFGLGRRSRIARSEILSDARALAPEAERWNLGRTRQLLLQIANSMSHSG